MPPAVPVVPMPDGCVAAPPVPDVVVPRVPDVVVPPPCVVVPAAVLLFL